MYLLAHGLPPGSAEVELAGADGLVEPVLGAEEGHRAGEEDVQQDPGRPHVHRLPVRPPLYHLCCGKISCDQRIVYLLYDKIGYSVTARVRIYHISHKVMVQRTRKHLGLSMQ